MSSFSSFATDIYNNQHLYRNQGKFCGLMLYHAGSNFFYHEDLNESEIDYAKKLLNGSKDLTPNIREFRNAVRKINKLKKLEMSLIMIRRVLFLMKFLKMMMP